jgi:uncharacterized repeat protein (TIGR01451 family)
MGGFTYYGTLALAALLGLAIPLGASGAPDVSATTTINEDTGFPGVCDAPCFSLEVTADVYFAGNATAPAVCGAGDTTYIYKLTHLGPANPIFAPFSGAPVNKFELQVTPGSVTSAGFIPGPDIDPSLTAVGVLNVVTWDFVAPPIDVSQSSNQLFVCSPLVPGTTGDTMVSADGPLALDAPGQSLGPFMEPVEPDACELQVEKFCEVVGDPGNGGDKDKDKDLDGNVDPPQQHKHSSCRDRLIANLVLEYTGLGCAASNNPQGDDPEMHTGRKGKRLCRGANRQDLVGATGQSPVRVLITSKRGRKVYLNQAGVNIGDEIVVDATAAAGRRKTLRGRLRIEAFDAAGNRVELDRFKTDCRSPLDPGDVFGSFSVSEFTSKDGTVHTTIPASPDLPAPVSECSIGLPRLDLPGDKDKDKDIDNPNPGAQIKYTYKITNTSATVTAENVTVIDDPDPLPDASDAFEVPGSPILSIAPGGIVELMSTQLITVDTVNTVTVSGQPAAPGECTAEASATVLVEEPGDVPDKDKDKDKDKDHDHSHHPGCGHGGW